MALNLSNLGAPKGANANKKRVGRGMGSGMGKTSTRGHDGQRARSGSRMMRGFEGGQMPLHRRLPKRGFTNIFRQEYLVLGLDRIELIASADERDRAHARDTAEARHRPKKNALVKVLANGEITKAVTVHAHKFSKQAQQKIEAAGGKAVVLGAAPAEAKLLKSGLVGHRFRDGRTTMVRPFSVSANPISCFCSCSVLFQFCVGAMCLGWVCIA